jgi:hypothetical protein
VKLRFYEDPETGQPHIYRHAVTESEVEEVLARSLEDRAGVRARALRSARRRLDVTFEWCTWRIRSRNRSL